VKRKLQSKNKKWIVPSCTFHLKGNQNKYAGDENKSKCSRENLVFFFFQETWKHRSKKLNWDILYVKILP
jgi:hypothetical protein